LNEACHGVPESEAGHPLRRKYLVEEYVLASLAFHHAVSNEAFRGVLADPAGSLSNLQFEGLAAIEGGSGCNSGKGPARCQEASDMNQSVFGL